jgi:hypothetical protein
MRSKVYSDNTSFDKLIEYLAQSAGGLAKAHATGITKRSDVDSGKQWVCFNHSSECDLMIRELL